MYKFPSYVTEIIKSYEGVGNIKELNFIGDPILGKAPLRVSFYDLWIEEVDYIIEKSYFNIPYTTVINKTY